MPLFAKYPRFYTAANTRTVQTIRTTSYLASVGLAQGAPKRPLQGLTAKKRGAKPAEHNPLSPKVRQLEAKVARLEKELATAHTILDVQSKISGLLGINLNDGKDC